MPKDTGANSEGLSPEITESRSKPFSNPITAFKERRASKASAAAAAKAGTSQPTETDAADRRPLVPQADEAEFSATNAHEQDSYASMMRATRDMNPKEVKAYLAQKAEADHAKHKNDTTWSGKNFSSY